MTSVIEVESANGVEVWSLNAPPANPLGPELADAWEAQLAQTLADASVSAVVITSALKLFSAGADAKWVAEVFQSEGGDALLDQFQATLERFRSLWLEMRRSDVLFIAAVNGHAIAGGLELAAACDLRFAADNDKIQIGASEMKLFGVMPSGGGGVQYITRLMGPSRALHFLLEAENCSPKVAQSLGLVDRLTEPDSLIGDARAFAERVAGRAGRIGVNAAKRLTLDAATLDLESAIDVDRTVHWDSMRRGGFLRGVEDFIAQYG
jgi:enoyl-CoA hydratase/carnithine racemase